MNRRQSERLTLNQNIPLLVLSEPVRSVSGVIVDISAKGLRFESTERIQPGSAIRIDLPEREASTPNPSTGSTSSTGLDAFNRSRKKSGGMILGEVCYSTPLDSGNFAAGVIFHQVLANLADLEPLLAALRPTPPTGALHPYNRSSDDRRSTNNQMASGATNADLITDADRTSEANITSDVPYSRK